MTSLSQVVILLLLSLSTILAREKFRKFHINETVSTRIVLRCPVTWSDEDSILYFHLKNNGDVTQLHQQLESKDSFLLDIAPESKSGHFECRVIHKKDGSTEKVSYYIDRQAQFKDITKLQYSMATTSINEIKQGDTLSLKCPIEGNGSTYLWFGPDLLQLNSSTLTLDIGPVRVEDFGDYFCGRLEDLKGTTLVTHKFVLKSPAVLYDANIKNFAKSLLYPTYKLGERVVYQPPTAYTLTRRLIWEYPPETVLLNQGRDFNREIFTHDMTQEEFYYRESDRIDPTYFTAKRILFQSTKMGQQSFNVNINPSIATVIIGNSIELSCNNSNNLKSIWYFKPSLNSVRQSLPEGVSIRIEGPFTIVQINSSEQRHSGTYVCDAKKGEAEVFLTVAPKPVLTVSPKEIVIRPGTNARFLCQLINGTGKVLWRRKDNKAFQLDVESRVGGDTQAILIISAAPKELNGSVYQCNHNELTAEALLMVKDLCPSNQRACTSGDCIDASRFCNGVPDCADKSDEDLALCAQCEPNQEACMYVDGKKPLQKCVVKHWYCDGDNDCGNGFDELNCSKINTDTCLSTNFMCNDNQTLIPRSLWCDKLVNCPNGDDESNCRSPEVVLPTKETTYVVHRNSSISLVCEVVSVPTSTINWRYNWGTLPQRLNFTIAQSGTDCNRIKNTLTIHNMDPDFAGVYTCEAVSASRAMGKDYTIFVTTEVLCKRPYFNNAASIKDMCLKCYCSNVTDDCTSANGYFQSSTLLVSSYSRAQLMNFLTQRIMETGNHKSLFDPKTKIYKFYDDSYTSLVFNPNMYLSSDFGLAGSWLQSYSFYMIVGMKLTGFQFDDIPGPAVIIRSSSGKSLHWCRSDNSPVIYSASTGYVNMLKLSLWEKEDWYNNIACSVSSTRVDFLNVLKDVAGIMIRIKYYSNQTGFEFHNVTLEHAIPATKEGETGVLVPRVEMCKCPFPFVGLSCEKCVEGYKRNSKNQCILKCPLNCDECKDKGECVKCKGYRSGPQCMQCKAGYTREVDKNMVENCVECKCGDLLNVTSVGTDCARDISSGGKLQCRCTGKEVNDAMCNKCLRVPLLPDDVKECTDKTKTENPTCSKHGTEIINNKKCECKMAYKGESCTECQAGYFQYEGKCLKCFCSNVTNQCQSSSDYKFTILTLNSEDFKLDLKLTNRLLSGIYPANTGDGDLKVVRSDNKIVLKRNPNSKGLIYLTITVEDVANRDSINTYTMMYGGKIMFKFEYMSDKLNSLTFNDVIPFLEIESKKLGRLWVPLKYNDESKFMEAQFSEDSFPSWRMAEDDRVVDRATLIRALMTSQHISIGIHFSNDLVRKVRITQLAIEHARKQTGPGRTAPVELCPCLSSTSGVKCEGCNQGGFKSVMTLSDAMPDFACGQCTGTSCLTCAAGSYSYDFLLNKNFSTCQPGIEIKTKGRVIQLNRGESLSIPCSVKSYKGGVAVHTWTKQGGMDQLNVFRHFSDDGISDLVLNFDKIKLSDTGYYTCAAKNALTNASEEFYIHVIDKDPRLKIDIVVLKQDKLSIKFDVSVVSPKNPTDYKVIWSVVKDGKVTTEESYKVNVKQEVSQYKIDVEITTNLTNGVQLRGVVVGSRVTNPFFYEVRYNISRNISIQVGDTKFSTDKNILNLKFLESGVVRVLTSPDIRIETFWYKVTENGTELPLPHGISTRGSELIVWSASESHNGKYVGYVINTDDGTKVGKVHTEVKVSSMIPDIGKEMVNETRATNISIHLYVPLIHYCPHQIWELHNAKSKSIIDITENVIRVSEREVIINYPLGLGDILRFRCSVVPDAKLTGEIKISLESKYPILEVIRKFEAIFPVTLECIDKNYVYPSNITWYFNDKPIGNNRIIDWRTFGGFRSDVHEGTYTCFAGNAYNNATKLVKLPESRAGTKEGYIKITSSTNPVAFENGTLRIYLIAGQRFKVSANLVGFPPLGTEIKWFLNNNTVSSSNNGKYYSTLEITSTTIKEYCGTYRVELLLPNGTTVRKTFEVIPQEESQYYAKIDGLNANGDLSILEGDNRVIGCKLIKKEKNAEIEDTKIKIEWKFVDSVGGIPNITDVTGLKTSQDNRALDIINARQILNRYRGQCHVTYDGQIYSSKYFTFDVNQRNIDPRVKLIGLKDNKFVDNEEGATSEVICQAYDENSKRVLPNAEYKWEMTFNVQNKKTNWEKMKMNEDKITFGGLVYHKNTNSAVGRCVVNYFGNILKSDEFTFQVRKKERNATLPEIKIDIIFESTRPPYPVAVSCRDPNVKPGTLSNITFTVSNQNFERSSVTTQEGWLLINFTTNGTSFNPYKDSGVYTFSVTNKNGHISKKILLPQKNNPNSNYSANIVIYSTTGKIENGRMRVMANSELKLLCVYYGHPYPIYLKWTMRRMERSSPVIESTDYWTTITIPQFNVDSNSGEYECSGQSHQGMLTKKVVLEGYSFGIKIEILDENGAAMGKEKFLSQGDNFVIKYRATDLYTNKDVTNINGTWEIRFSKSDNFSEISAFNLTFDEVKYEGVQMTLTKIYHSGQLEVRCKFKNKTDVFVSDIVKLNIKETVELHPEPHFFPIYKESIYPKKLKCVDTSIEPSKVVLSKMLGVVNDRLKYEEKPKESVAIWENPPFTPYYDMGTYKCVASNRYKTKEITMNFPEQTDRLVGPYVQFESRINEIVLKDQNKTIEVVNGDKFMIVCNYFGSRVPITDVDIVFESKSGEALFPSTFATQFEVKSYYSLLRIDQFDMAKHSGIYTCRSKNATHSLIDTVAVQGIKPGLKVSIEGLDPENRLKLVLGSARSFKCTAIDAVTKKVVLNGKYDWNLETMKGESFNVDELSETIKKKDGNVTLGIVKSNEDLRGRCEVTLKNETFYSNYFDIIMVEDETKKPKLQLIELLGDTDREIPSSLLCTDGSKNLSTITITRLNGAPPNVTFNTSRNSMELIFPVLINDPMVYVGMYRCDATNKFGKDWKETKVVYKPKPKPLKVKIEVKDLSLAMKVDSKTLEVPVGKRFELDCIYSGDKQPISVNWLVTDKNNVTKLERDKPFKGFLAYQKRSDCLSLLQESFTEKTSVMVNCSAEDNAKTIKSDFVIINTFIDGVRVMMEGLDNSTHLTVKQGSDKILTCKVIDLKTDSDISKSFRFVLIFRDQTGKDINLEQLAEKSIYDNGKLTLSSLANLNQTLTASCLAGNDTHLLTSEIFTYIVTWDDTKKPKINFIEVFGASGQFPMKLECKDIKDPESDVTITRADNKPIPDTLITKMKGSMTITFPDKDNNFASFEAMYLCKGVNKYGSDQASLQTKQRETLSVTLNSTINKILTDPLGNLYTIVRKNRKLELNCYVTGTPLPDVKFNIITEGYRPDLPVPSRKIALVPRDSNSPYFVDVVTEKHYRLSKPYYSQSPPFSFSCDASLDGKSASSLVKVIEALDIFKVNIISHQQNQLNQIVYLDKPFEISCEMRDENAKLVPTQSIKWILKSQKGEIIDLNKLAQKVVFKDNSLMLEGVSVTFGSLIRGRCALYYNETYDTLSDEFNLNIKESPKITGIFVELKSGPTTTILPFPLNYTYNAADITVFTCKANTTNGARPLITWIKCLSADCNSSTTAGLGNSLIFYQDSTTYTSVGEHRCVVTLTLDIKTVSETIGILHLGRKAAPKQYSPQKMDARQSFVLICDNAVSSPEGNLTWSFIPQGKSEATTLPVTAVIKTNNQKSQLSIGKPLKLEYSGTYICNVTNEYGTGGRTFNVNIQSFFRH